MFKQPSTTTKPRWLSLADAGVYAGVSKRLVEVWDKAGHIRVSRVITEGHVKGRVLVCRESLDAFIEGYIGVPPHAAAINRHRQPEGEPVAAEA